MQSTHSHGLAAAPYTMPCHAMPRHPQAPTILTRTKVKVQVSTRITVVHLRIRRRIPTRLITRIAEIPRTPLARDSAVPILCKLARRPRATKLVVQTPIRASCNGIVELGVRLGDVGAGPCFETDAGVGGDGFDVDVAGGDAEYGGGVELVDVLDVDGEGAVVGYVGVAVLGEGGGGEGSSEGEEGDDGFGHCGVRLLWVVVDLLGKDGLSGCGSCC